MTAISHHIPEDMLIAYAAGTLPRAFSLVVASHVSMCLECRAALEAHHMVGGAVLETSRNVALSGGLKDAVLANLDAPHAPAPQFNRKGIFPAPIMEALNGREPRWSPMGLGVGQQILFADNTGSARLLHIPPGHTLPDHGHHGIELTLVLQGSVRDETGHFGVGDVEVADEGLDHAPVVDEGEACICLAAADAALKFQSFVPRILQPFFRI